MNRQLIASLLAASAIAGTVSAITLQTRFEQDHVRFSRPGAPAAVFPSDGLQFCFKVRHGAMIGFPRDVDAWAECEDALGSAGVTGRFERDTALVSGGAFLSLVAGVAAFGGALRQLPPIKVTRGPKLHRGRKAHAELKRAGRAEIRLSGKGLAFPPGLLLSRDRESRHFLISGGVGSGKTQTLRSLILAAMQRGDHVLVLDTKGDMTRDLPGDIILLAPQDARSAVWHVAADCRTRQDARELASRFIPRSSDPMWSEAAREVFVTCVVSLQAEKPGAWTWADLYARAILEPEALLGLARTHHPAAVQLLSEPSSKTTMSILTTFKAHLHSIEALAEAWDECNDKLFPVSRWLSETEPTVPIVVQRDGRYPQLSNAWISGLIGLIASHVGSPSFSESTTRRVWLFLDEFPQLEQMEDFSALLDLGRSKGVCVVLTAQDTSQIRIRYGRDQTNSWTSMIGTHIITRMNVGEGAEDVSRALGVQEIEKPVRSESYSGGKHSKSISMQPSTRPVITPSEIASRLGPRRSGVRVLLVGIGEDYHEVDLPYVDLPPVREAHVPAAWTTGNAPPRRPGGRRPLIATPLLTPDDLCRIRKPKPEDFDA